MRTLLRSCFVVKIADAPELLHQNILALDASGLTPNEPEEKTLWRLIRDFAKLHQHAPDVKTLQLQLSSLSDLAALDYLEQVVREPTKTRGDFAVYLEKKLEDRRQGKLLNALHQAIKVATTGLELEDDQGKKHKLRGVDEASALLYDELHRLERPPTGIRLSGDVASSVADLRAEYLSTEPTNGRTSGIEQMDKALGGVRPGELWVHAAYSGHLKTTLALNWSYNLAYCGVDGRNRNILYFSLEMPYRQTRRWVAAMHSIHWDFRQARLDLGVQLGIKDVGLDYRKIRDKDLTDGEQTFYLDYVLPDLEREHHGRIHFETSDPSKPDVTVEGLRRRAEALYREMSFDMIVVDHGSLLGARSKYTSTTDRLNEALRDLKQLALNFHRGQGIPILVLYQINREGLKEAHKKKAKGELPLYELHNLSYASEAERSADVVTATYLDQSYAERGRALLSCLKARDNAPFEPCLMRVEWPCRRLLGCMDPVSSVAPTKRQQVDITKDPSALNFLNAPTSQSARTRAEA